MILKLKSGWIITAAHVVVEGQKSDLVIIFPDGQKSSVDSVTYDSFLDLALVKPSKSFQISTLSLSTKKEIKIGEMVSTWGFPSGYNSLIPLLTVGYLSGVSRTDY